MSGVVKKLAILFLHGMGPAERDYSDGLQKKIRKDIGNKLYDQIEMVPIFYSTEMAKNQKDMIDRMKREYDLDWNLPREIMTYFCSDVMNIGDYKTPKGMGYYVTNCIKDALNSLATTFKTQDYKILAVSQSLGNQVLSNYIWDAQKSTGIFADKPATETEKLTRLEKWYSTGNNMPLFVSGIKEAYIKSIDKPNDKFIWKSYFDKDDVLGWPLAPLSPQYRDKLGVKDFEVKTGITPVAAHLRYWKDRKVVGDICDGIRELLGA
jgi:hypothetical protein